MSPAVPTAPSQVWRYLRLPGRCGGVDRTRRVGERLNAGVAVSGLAMCAVVWQWLNVSTQASTSLKCSNVLEIHVWNLSDVLQYMRVPTVDQQCEHDETTGVTHLVWLRALYAKYYEGKMHELCFGRPV